MEILLQDDASPEYNAVELFSAPLKVARNELNLGFAGNCNAGAARATGDYLMFLNQDTQALTPGWADIMLAIFAKHPDAGLAGPKLLFPDGNIQSCGGLFDVNKGPFHRHLGWSDAQDWRVNTDRIVSWMTGAAIMIARADFIALEGFDEGYRRGYFEDVDLCMRVKRELRKEVWYCAGAEFMHSVGSAGGVPASTFKANSMRFHEKWDKHIVSDSQFQHVDY